MHLRLLTPMSLVVTTDDCMGPRALQIRLVVASYGVVASQPIEALGESHYTVGIKMP